MFITEEQKMQNVKFRICDPIQLSVTESNINQLQCHLRGLELLKGFCLSVEA